MSEFEVITKIFDVTTNPIPLNVTTKHMRVNMYKENSPVSKTKFDVSKLTWTPNQAEEYRKKNFKVSDTEAKKIVGNRISNRKSFPVNVEFKPKQQITDNSNAHSVVQRIQSLTPQARTNIAAKWLKDEKDKVA